MNMQPVDGAAREAERQNALLAALFDRTLPPGDAALEVQMHPAGFAEQGARLRRGLQAYRANGSSIAERALAAAYPTLWALVGAEDADALARALWRNAPPRRGDLAQWGHDLPEFIEAQRDLDPWPYLADCARLDAAVSRCEAAAEPPVERDTLALLAEHAPEVLRLRLQPSLQLLDSRWPVATLHAAHHGPDGQAMADAQERARAAVALRQAEAVLVARAGWRARPLVLEPAVFAWMQALQSGATLADALERAGDAFDFNAWLVQALQQGWLWKAQADASPDDPDTPEENLHDPVLA